MGRECTAVRGGRPGGGMRPQRATRPGGGPGRVAMLVLRGGECGVPYRKRAFTEPQVVWLTGVGFSDSRNTRPSS